MVIIPVIMVLIMVIIMVTIMIIIVIIMVIIMLNNFCFHVIAQKCQVVGLSDCQVRFLGTRDMLNKFLFLCPCSNLTVYRRKWQWFFYTLSSEFIVHRADSQIIIGIVHTSVCICVIMSLWGSRIIIQGDSWHCTEI